MAETTYDDAFAGNSAAWGPVVCLSLLTFVLVASEFMPVSLLTPIARDLAIAEGQAGQAIAISGFFAVITSLFGNSLLARLDRRTVVLLYTSILIISGLAVAFAANGLAFMLGRALVGVAIGGFWSLSTAIVSRLVSGPDLPKALALLQGGTAFAAIIAAPLGSFLGGLIGWRGAFFIVVPAGLLGLAWQIAVLPKMPPRGGASVASMFRLLRNRVVLLGMAATTLAFMGQFSLSTYLRPFLEGVTGLDVNGLSLVLLALGVAGLAGTSVAGLMLKGHLARLLVGLPSLLSIIAVALIALGQWPVAVASLLIVWGFLSTPIPVAWGTWMTKVIPNDLEAGGGLQVALVQVAITLGAFTGGLLFDSTGWWSPFALGAVLLVGSAGLALTCVKRARLSGGDDARRVAALDRETLTRREAWNRAIGGGLMDTLTWASLFAIDDVSPDNSNRPSSDRSQMTDRTRRAFLGLMIATPLSSPIILGEASAQEKSLLMKIRVKFQDQDFAASLHDNASAREFAAMLPLDLTIEDFSSNEKIAYLPRKLTELTRGPFADAAPGDLCYYVPWGNLAFFHGGYESTRDLVRLGRLDGAVQPLLTRGEFRLRIELA